MARDVLGTGGNDKLKGLRGVQDFFVGLAGKDSFKGNGGRDGDTADYSRDADNGATHGVKVNLLGSGSQAGLAADTAIDSFGFKDKLVNIPNVIGTQFADRIYGGAHNNVLRGGLGDDLLSGHNGSDRLLGEDGNDQLIGGLGADKLFGGTGADAFVFTKFIDSTVSGLGRDTIMDFSQAEGDLINLSKLDANIRKAGNQAFTFIGDDAFHRKAGELHYQEKAGNTIVTGDVNGDARADFAIVLKGEHHLTAADFIL